MRLPRRFCRVRADVDLCRGILDLRARTVDDRRDPFFFAAFPCDPRLRLRDLGRDFFTGCRFSARLTAFRTGRSPVAAFPARAPTTPPTTAPTGPAMLPIAAPVTAPAVCFGIGGTWMSSDVGGLVFFSVSG